MNELTEYYRMAAEAKRLKAVKTEKKAVLSWQLVYIFGGKTQVIEADKPYGFLVAKMREVKRNPLKGQLKIVPSRYAEDRPQTTQR
jgi:hypothetical protein